MFELSMTTALLINAIAYGLSGLIIIYIFHLHSETYGGGKEFSLYFILSSIGVLLILMRDSLPLAISILLANLLLYGAKLLLMKAIFHFNNVKFRSIYALISTLVYMCFYLYWTYASPNVGLRIAIYTIAAATIHLIILMVILGHNTKSKIDNNILVLANFFSLFYFILRLVVMLLSQESYQDFLSYNIDAYLVSFEGLLSFVLVIGILAKITSFQYQKMLVSEKEYRALFDYAGLGIGYFTPDGTLKWFNQIAASNMGGKPEDFSGKHMMDLFSEKDATVYMQRLRETIAEGKTKVYEDNLHLPTGQFWFRSQYNCIYNDDDQLLGLEIISSDVTDLRLSERALLTSENNFKVLFEDAPLAYQSLNEDGCFITINNAWLELLLYEREEVIGRSFADFITPEFREHFKVNFPKFKYQGATCTVFDMIKKNGESVTVQFNGRIGYNDDGSFRQTHCIMLDITARQAFEAEKERTQSVIRNKQKLESIGTLASGIAHEINNPINGIMNYSQLILDAQPVKEVIVAYSTEIMHETNRVSTIVNNLLQFSKHDTKQFSTTHIEDIIEQTLSLIRTTIQRDQIELDITIDPDLPPLQCRSQQIQQVVMNLVTNARDALNEKYEGQSDHKLIQISATSFDKDAQPWIRLNVTDYGNGIDPAVQTQIFDPFFTTKGRQNGTGLGLSISYGIIKDHHGSLTFKSSPSEGTTFTVELPVKNEFQE